MTSSACLFCRIAQHDVPAAIVLEEPALVAFKDIHPQAPTHLVIIPREHLARVSDASTGHAALLGGLLLAANRLAQQLQLQDGYRLVINCGPQAGQTVDHLHLHLLGGRAMRWPPG
ncbi:MAG: HIT domain-containing protein [Candidatus Omnitrophica bacterium]|nr:HIT domain-containing protein [Candidatus Omnitrophota bacterium]